MTPIDKNSNMPPESEAAAELLDTQLDAALQSYTVDAPSDLLAARILKMAKATPQQKQTFQDIETGNIRQENVLWREKRYGFGIAALLLISLTFAFGTLNFAPSDTESDTAEIWLEAAADLGMSDIYDWVEGQTNSMDDTR